MHPAPSVIAFTTLSGAGFGLLVFLGLGLPAVTGWSAAAFLVIAYLLAAGGLVASTFHLGHPERALKAFSQWRSSWLSREAWVSVAALLTMAGYGAGLVLLSQRWAALGWLGAALCLATVLATSMIYASLRTVPAWHHWTTPAVYLTSSLAGGALLAGQVSLAVPLLVLAGGVVAGRWAWMDRQTARSTQESATGLGSTGAVRAFEAPHTGQSYLTREMVYRVARRRSGQLRLAGLALGYAVPALLLLLPFAHWVAALAVLSHLAGVAATRWLFFAEARHVVGLYYGRA